MRDRFFEEFYRSINRMNKLFEEFDDFFYDRAFPNLLQEPSGKRDLIESKRIPYSQLEEKDKEIIARIELPGIDKKDIDLNISEDMLEVKAEHKKEKEEEKKGVKTYSLSQRGFYRTIKLPCEVNPDNVKANFKNGVLEIIMPKQKQIESKKILIE